MKGQITSIQVGRIQSYVMHRYGDAGKTWSTAFYKEPVNRPVIVERGGIEGDAQADRKHHGGADKAVLVYALEHYRTWAAEYPHLSFSPGGFGENLTVAGLNEETVCVGDAYRIGNVLVEVSQPRTPCWKISERWQASSLTDRVRQTGRTGWYVRVRAPGVIAAGDALELVDRPHPDLSLSLLNDLLFGRVQKTKAVLDALQSCRALANAWRSGIPELRDEVAK
ncbi:MOSC domain-containing protein [Alicyclobacillus acidoterrestris]|uniref:MOSC domain-containing protein n=1 Tax=Alicyclobacillus acidoterrestris TaxID=1450 RepID=UPI003F52E55C